MTTIPYSVVQGAVLLKFKLEEREILNCNFGLSLKVGVLVNRSGPGTEDATTTPPGEAVALAAPPPPLVPHRSAARTHARSISLAAHGGGWRSTACAVRKRREGSRRRPPPPRGTPVLARLSDLLLDRPPRGIQRCLPRPRRRRAYRRDLALPVLAVRLRRIRGAAVRSLRYGVGDVSGGCLACDHLAEPAQVWHAEFLFVDQHHGYVVRFQEKYISKIQDFFHWLLWWILPCSLVKIAREIVRCTFILHESTWRAVLVFLASMLSWLYLTAMLLSATLLFNLVCNLQIIHFEDYGKVFERDVDPVMHLGEHTRLLFYLSKISHRFRIFLLLLFLFVTSSQFVTLIQTTGYGGNINFVNAGDIAVSSVVQVVVVILCLNAASKISHRAQGIASLASRWHAYVTCSPTGSQMQNTNSAGNMEAIPESSSVMDNSESDLESFEDMLMQNTSQFTSSMLSFHKRQALVTYLQSNPGGITIFGWTVD